MISWLYQLSQTILHGRDAILRVRDKWLIFNIVSQLWADVKYHVPTRFGFSPKAICFYSFGDATALAGEGGVGGVVWLIQASASNHKPKKSQTKANQSKPKQTKGTVLLVCICQRHTKRTVPLVCGLCGLLEIRHATSPTTGAKHWHR